MDNIPQTCPFCGRDGATAETTCMEWEMYKARKLTGDQFADSHDMNPIGTNLKEDLEEIYQRGVKRGKEIRRGDG